MNKKQGFAVLILLSLSVVSALDIKTIINVVKDPLIVTSSYCYNSKGGYSQSALQDYSQYRESNPDKSANDDKVFACMAEPCQQNVPNYGFSSGIVTTYYEVCYNRLQFQLDKKYPFTDSPIDKCKVQLDSCSKCIEDSSCQTVYKNPTDKQEKEFAQYLLDQSKNSNTSPNTCEDTYGKLYKNTCLRNIQMSQVIDWMYNNQQDDKCVQFTACVAGKELGGKVLGGKEQVHSNGMIIKLSLMLIFAFFAF